MASEYVIPKEAKIKYLERRKDDLAACRQALSDNNYACLVGLGHQIKGNAITFGYNELGSIAIEMEALALKKDSLSLNEILNRFELFLNQNK